MDRCKQQNTVYLFLQDDFEKNKKRKEKGLYAWEGTGSYELSGADGDAWLTCLMVGMENTAYLRSTKEMNLQDLEID